MVYPVANHRMIERYRIRRQRRPAGLKRKQTHHIAHLDGFLHESRHQTRSGNCHIHAPGIIEKPLVPGIIHTRYRALYTKLAAAQQRYHQINFVVTGRGNNYISGIRVNLAQNR